MFAPSQADFEHASRIIEAYDHATTVEARGAVMLGDEMIDEDSRKMAQAIVARGRAACRPDRSRPRRSRPAPGSPEAYGTSEKEFRALNR